MLNDNHKCFLINIVTKFFRVIFSAGECVQIMDIFQTMHFFVKKPLWSIHKHFKLE